MFRARSKAPAWDWCDHMGLLILQVGSPSVLVKNEDRYLECRESMWVRMGFS